MDKNFIEEIKWRGMYHDMMPDTDKQLEKEMTSGYIGFDPTAASLHIGNLVQIMILKHFQLAGHKPIALVGGATGMIGDPSGKSAERNLLSEESLRHNQDCIQKQLEKFLDFKAEKNPAEIVNNYDWFKDFDFLTFLRDVGKHLSINYMMAKDSVKNRLETGISFTEFSYQLLQGYDFYWLYKNKNVKLQMGGSDQWGNITTGTELIGRKDAGKAFALTVPLLTKGDGTKFGKSEEGNVWLDPKMTSPYKFYQFWINVADSELPKLLRCFTLFTKDEIEEMEKQYLSSNPNELKRILAKDITTRVHSLEEAEKAAKTSNLLFDKNTNWEDLENTEEDVLSDIFSSLPRSLYNKDQFEAFPTILDLLADALNTSKGDVKRNIKGNALAVNLQKITEANANEKPNFDFLKNKYILIKNGKKYHLIQIAS